MSPDPSSNGLYGILESQCLWATHYRFLNDSKEFFAARSSLEKFMESEIRKKIDALKAKGKIKVRNEAASRVFAAQEAAQIVELLYTATFGDLQKNEIGADAFIFSGFCSSPASKGSFCDGELLHWATYARNGGYAIQLNPHKLAQLLWQENEHLNLPFIFKHVSYAEEGEVVASLADSYKEIGDVVQRLVERNILRPQDNVPDFGRVAVSFVEIISTVKNNYFKNESEARITILRGKRPRKDFKWHELHIRHKNAVAIPYVKLFEGKLLGENCPIDRIIIGPHPDNDRRAVALNTFLRDRKLSGIDVTVSRVPYVNVGES